MSPFLTGGLPSYLKRFGYRTTAFYTTDGDFFNVENAFRIYGIDAFKTPAGIDVRNGWYARDSVTAMPM